MLKNLVIAVLCVSVSLLAWSAAADESVPGTVADLAWMTGSWAGPAGEQTLEENWIQPVGGTIASLVRLTGAGATSMVELIVVEETEGTLVLRIQQWDPGQVPRTAEPQVMVLGSLGDNQVSFKSTGATGATGLGGFKTLSYSRPSPESFNVDVENQDGAAFQIKLTAQ